MKKNTSMKKFQELITTSEKREDSHKQTKNRIAYHWKS